MAQFKKSENDPVAFEKYKEMQRRSKNIIKSAKQNFEQKLAKNVKTIIKVSFLMLGASNILLKKLDQLRIVWVVWSQKIKMSLFT